jgi:AcrR family transcriptional regulator
VEVPEGRRERKKAATREVIARTAARLFLRDGFEPVGLRQVAQEADVAVTTLFAHFPCKEALVFWRSAHYEEQLVEAVRLETEDTKILANLRRAVADLVLQCSTLEARPLWQLVDRTPALVAYEAGLRRQYADAVAAALGAVGQPRRSDVARHALARALLEAYSLARTSSQPLATLDELFPLLEASWAASVRVGLPGSDSCATS